MPDEKKGYCPICGKKTLIVSDYIHDYWWLDRYLCESCGYRFDASNDLGDDFTE